MAVNGEVELVWADGEHKFNIAKVAQILELEEKCGAGLPEILTRLSEGKWKLNDLRETVRLGLIGAGLDPLKALGLVQKYVDNRPLTESVQVAMVVIMAALVGVTGDQPGKKEKAERDKEPQSSETMADSPAPQSMGSEQLSAGPQGRQMN